MLWSYLFISVGLFYINLFYLREMLWSYNIRQVVLFVVVGVYIVQIKFK